MSFDFYGFYTGKMFDAYEWLGAHVTNDGVIFRTFAPNACRIELLLNEKFIPMNQIGDGNYYEVKVADAKEGDL